MASSFKESQSPAAVPTVGAGDQKTSFELAVERALGRYSAEMWAQLAPGERSQAIYEELRLIDTETALTGRRHR
jgi:hypothetical protein